MTNSNMVSDHGLLVQRAVMEVGYGLFLLYCHIPVLLYYFIDTLSYFFATSILRHWITSLLSYGQWLILQLLNVEGEAT